MKPRLLLATGNAFKARELALMLGPLPIELLTLKDFPGMAPVDEDQPTLEGNASKKARATALYCGVWTLADDTGLEVEALGGEPGVHSARYAGPKCDFGDNNRKLLKALERIGGKDRRARFRCVMALSDPKGEVSLREGALDGQITETYAGDEGFGYDPVFFVPELGKTLGELSLEAKCKVSHRFRAIEAVKPLIVEKLGAAAGGAIR